MADRVRPLTNIASIWLELLRAQRPLRYGELGQAMQDLPHSIRGPSLVAAFELGYIERTGKPRAYEYQVTPRCNVPPGITVVEVMEATA